MHNIWLYKYFLTLENIVVFYCSNDVSSLLASNWKVYGGVVSLDILPRPYQVRKIILNENYDSRTNDQDVALLKLSTPVDFNG